MSDFRFFTTHRTRGRLAWRADRGVALVSRPGKPFEVIDAVCSDVILNTFVVGMIVFGLAQLEYVALRR